MEKYKEHRVTELPTEGLKEGDKYHLLVGGEYYTSFIVSKALNLIPLTAIPSEEYAPQSDTDIFD